MVQSGGNPIPAGQDLVASLLHSSGHGRLLGTVDDFLLLQVRKMSSHLERDLGTNPVAGRIKEA